jgi:hypothetical protein
MMHKGCTNRPYAVSWSTTIVTIAADLTGLAGYTAKALPATAAAAAEVVATQAAPHNIMWETPGVMETLSAMLLAGAGIIMMMYMPLLTI